MSIKQKIQDDLKKAMLSGDKQVAAVLQGIKSALLYAEVEAGKREKGLSDDEALAVLGKEAKKRQESIELYKQGGSQDQADAEAFEKSIIENYLPAKLTDDELRAIINEELAKIDNPTIKDMGMIIGAVKRRAGLAADGATLAKMVKESLSG